MCPLRKTDPGGRAALREVQRRTGHAEARAKAAARDAGGADRPCRSDPREAEFAAVQETLDETKRSLSDAQGEIAAQDEQLEQLRTELSDAQHAANQSQYDMTAQKAELERLREENAALQDSVTELEESEQSLTEENESLREQKDALTAERDELKEENQKLSEKSKFMDAYVVFVDNDKTGLYHKFGCSAFSRKSFWAYSRKLAESFGYTPCPKCFG